MKNALGALAIGLVLTGCNQVDYIEIEPNPVVFKQKNNDVWLRAKAMSHTGDHQSRAKVSWSVKDAAIAKVDEAGRLYPVKSGVTEVIAEHGKVKATVPVQVLFAEKITIEPPVLTLSEGQDPVELSVKVYDYLGRELRDRTPMFKAGDKEIVSLGQNAVFPGKPGDTEVTVQVEDLIKKIPVRVEPTKVARIK